MSLIKFMKDEPLFPSFASWFDDFWGKDSFNAVQLGTSVPAVNITDDGNAFKIELAAPGLKKEDFKVSLDHKVLTISAEHKEEKEEKSEGKVTRREYSFSSFKRSFALPDNVQVENIEANYVDGVLRLNVPKKEITHKANATEIKVS